MAQQDINVGTVANDGTGDPLRTAFQKTQANFDELYAGAGGGAVDSVNGQTGVVSVDLQSALEAGATAAIGGAVQIVADGGVIITHNDTATSEITNNSGNGIFIGPTSVAIVGLPLDMGSNKVTGLAAATANGDAVRYEQVVSADTTGTAISFAVPQIYGSDGSPETGNITIVTTGLVKGMTQLLIHNNGSEPTYGSEIKIISGTYTTGELNYIMLMAVSSSLVLVTISQQL
jgi:hypothetical protein